MAVSTIPAVVATPRTGKFNKNAARRVRVSGQIPAVVYGAGIDPVAVAVDPKVITKILHSDSGHNTIFDLDVTGAGPAKAMIVDWQHEPIKGKLLHIDLKRIAMDKTMRVSVPIQLVGIPVGVKATGASSPPNRYPGATKTNRETAEIFAAAVGRCRKISNHRSPDPYAPFSPPARSTPSTAFLCDVSE